MGFLNFSRDFDLFAEKVGTLQGARMDHSSIDSDFGKNSQNRVGNRVSARRRNSGELWRCKISLRDFLPLSLRSHPCHHPSFRGFLLFFQNMTACIRIISCITLIHSCHSGREIFSGETWMISPMMASVASYAKPLASYQSPEKRVHVSLVLSCDNSEEFDTDAWSLIGQKKLRVMQKKPFRQMQCHRHYTMNIWCCFPWRTLCQDIETLHQFPSIYWIFNFLPRSLQDSPPL